MEELTRARGVYVGNEDLVKVAATLEDAGLNTPCVGFGNTEPVQRFLVRGNISAAIDDHRYLQGYFAVQKAYEAIAKKKQSEPLSGIRIPSDVVFAANAIDTADPLYYAFEMLMRQRTKVLLSYKQRLEHANAELLSLAVTDPLTGLANRRKFEEVLANETARAARYGALSLLMIDLDFFKLVNDEHGHQTGDAMLQNVAALLQSCCRTTDTCARLGGDEFAVILPHCDGESAGVVRDRILKECDRAAVSAQGHQLRISLSVGIANLPGDAKNAEQLIAAADRDMYRVKQAARPELTSAG